MHQFSAEKAKNKYTCWALILHTHINNIKSFFQLDCHHHPHNILSSAEMDRYNMYTGWLLSLSHSAILHMSNPLYPFIFQRSQENFRPLSYNGRKSTLQMI